jgi:hypothetical protein
MNSNQNTIRRVQITYPQKPGFIILCHELLTEIRSRFCLSGSSRLSPTNNCTVTLDEITVYSSYPENPNEIERLEIIYSISRLTPPVAETMLAESKKDTDDPDPESWDDCLCSGE